jgi:DNA-binding transcriptional regulator LsrR (DeoR family)
MTATKLLTKRELAEVLSLSTRTIDRLRARGIDLGEVRLHDRATPRFDPAKVQAAIQAGKFGKKKRAA